MIKLSRVFALFLSILVISLMSNSTCNNSGGGTPLGPPFQNPSQISSVDGVLDLTFDVDVSPGEVDGQPFMSAQYNGMFAPPTLRVNPGDTILLDVINFLEAMTNVHYHGMQVSPLSPSDDIFIMIPSNGVFQYEVEIPEDHPQGLYYYHAHLFGLTTFQIMSGLSGGIIIGNNLAPFPQLDGITDQVMYLKDIQIVDGMVPPGMDINASAPTNFTVNGLTNPVITMRPGETQYWQFFNIGANLYYDLVLDGHTFFQIERDGLRQTRTLERTEILMPTASRVGVLVQAKERGKFSLRAREFNTGPAGDMYGGATLLTVIVEGEPVENPIVLPIPENEFPPVENLCDITPDNRRTIVFSETPDGNTFFINDRQFNPERVDTTVDIGGVEEWTVQNISKELHVFHIHQVDFQVCEINGVEQPFNGLQDTINVPYQGQDPNVEGPGEVKIAIDFRNPIIEGKFVYHCHIGEHEDNGMMAVIEAVMP
ncbi:MAG: multicopper oxidase domain-containing protein [Deltaproteobacteria bacterium]|nr:multicopper oxidase domain-containing protein [Deltaproteobacteria bacterium]